MLPQTQLALQLWPLPSCKIYNSSKPCIISGYNGTYITRENNIHVSNIYGVRGPLLQTCRNQLPNWHLLAQDSSLWAGSKNHFFIRRSPYSWFQKKMLAVVNQSGNQRKNPKKRNPRAWGYDLGGFTFVTLENPGRPRCCENPWRLIFHFAYMPGSKALEEWEIVIENLYSESFFQPLRGENKPLQLG